MTRMRGVESQAFAVAIPTRFGWSFDDGLDKTRSYISFRWVGTPLHCLTLTYPVGKYKRQDKSGLKAETKETWTRTGRREENQKRRGKEMSGVRDD